MPHSDESARLITGVVQDMTGNPVPDASVYLAGGPEPYPDIAVLSAADGSFTLSVRADGVYTVQCRTPDGGVSETSVTASGGRPAQALIRI
ncbi:carboxypeptidase regulatory-like domain-containing protein [Streptomyces sp. NBC_00576]|uniref:carboxypeptidase regulatory-like domain-containing protein n=1 Tax=Streptomyces sp. NBC_00576 TaxID=2903665 RepID=UPI002E7FB43C|nr:carboxypeptidase regulatory-like domain-containing protein [Streptomyces sp. NBC_00576]WUB69868.1 carboxypeptidase regulatory-like domain-containing protein [Streptomyces sp. NBC_00576]